MSLLTAPAPESVGPGADDSVVQRLAELTEQFSQRADEYDRTSAFPDADFADLFAAGLNAPTVPVEYGGLGLGPFGRRAHPLWMMTAELAKVDLSLARCWEGHVNGLMLIDALGQESQRERWFEGVVERGEKWVVWSGEPQAPKPGEVQRFGTTVTRTADGWMIDGKKAFATSAIGADWAILMVNPAGPGGARHLGGSDHTLLLLACPLTHPSVTVDTSWWDPIGMRATASHVVTFDQTPIPEAWSIGEPGAFFAERCTAALMPHYAASFLGAAEGAYNYALEYIRRQAKGEDPYIQQRVGQMAVDVRTGHLWLSHVAWLWDSDQRELAQLAGAQTRQLIEHLALATVDHTIRSCGARCLLRPSPVERILRDLTLYARHDNNDRILATIGRVTLGLAQNESFL